MDPTNGTVVNQFAAPDALAAEHTRIGLAMAGLGSTLLYLNADVDPSRVYRLDPNTGAVLEKARAEKVTHREAAVALAGERVRNAMATRRWSVF